MTSFHSPTDAQDNLYRRAVGGDQTAAGELLEANRPRLTKMVRLRLGVDLRRRIDESDIIQDAFVDASQQFGDLTSDGGDRVYPWLRQIVFNKLMDACRHHLGTQKRGTGRDVSAGQLAVSEISTASLSSLIVDSLSSPSHIAMKAELRAAVHESLLQLDEVDREVLMLRHFDGLSTAEAGQVLGLSKSGAGKRYLKALNALRDIMDKVIEMSGEK